ncbi:restriction endonuclease subunit S [Marinigracilibium pacificum]|uniref:Specificity determinant for hsdM and hsdR n=1 Tax=Marinigracilibium pacificum TaxID=2729599 RepID=A0A848J3D3_9BACT|nr:restriction endonuclease subunit S [Marinigracilibium pacificum]NMM49838.1 specificity determinant for hsdM and hsdR [Marinigracilibium pacificum]
MNGIPKNWIETSFTDILNIKGGTQPPKSKFISEPKHGYVRLLQIRDFGDKPVPTYVPEENKLQKCTSNDILIARYGASIGRILTGMEGAYNVAMAKVLIPDLIDHRFIYWLLKSNIFQSPILSLQRTAQSGFNKNDLEFINLPIPPLAEQRRIVAKLDALFGHLDNLKAKLNRIPELLKNFRQSVLTQAVTGKLTEEWRVAENIKVGKFTILKELGEVLAGQSPKVSEVNTEGRGEKYITGPEQWDGKKFHKPKWTEFPKRIAPSNSIFITVKGAGVGKTFLGTKAAIGRDIYAFVPEDHINHKFVFYAIKATTAEIITNAKGLIPGLSKSHLQDHKIYYPGKFEQDEIVCRIDKLFSVADSIETQYNSLKDKIDNLPQAILQKAFKGELVPQDPNDEPASVLLERIKGEKGE